MSILIHGQFIDKGYNDLANSLCAAILDEKSINEWLTLDQGFCNKKISSDRVFLEKYFGVLNSFLLFG